MRDRLITGDVMSRFLDVSKEEATELTANSQQGEILKNMLFIKIIPNLTRIGLITDKVKPKYDKLGVLSYQEMEDNFHPDWLKFLNPTKPKKKSKKLLEYS